MQHKLLRHAQLTKEIQLEIKITDAEHDITIFHQKVAFFPLAGKFALFQPTADEWHDFVGPRKIVENANMADEKIYYLLVTAHAPGDVQPFTFEGVGERKTLSGVGLETHLLKLLKIYQLYSAVEYEK